MVTHGGRRHGLSPAGASPSTKFRLGAAADARLREIGAASGLTLSEIVRRLVLSPDALAIATADSKGKIAP